MPGEPEDQLPPTKPIMKITIYNGVELEIATNNFSKNNLLDEGGNGQVYWGILDETKVAIKRPSQGEKEEDNDQYIKHLSHDFNIHAQIINHPSIVSLIGCGFNGDQFYIAYEFMSNGSLYQHLHEHRTNLPWLTRLAILRQTVGVLSFLHNESDPRIIHADVKSENILLDENLNPKLCDFGHSQIVLHKAGHESQLYISMVAEGTPHLIDPYWRRNGQLTDKTDVHGVGVLAVELLTRRKTKDLKRGCGGEFLINKEELMVAIDPSLLMVDASKKVGNLDQMKALGYLAVKCLSEDIEDRPSMKQVLNLIECIIKWGE